MNHKSEFDETISILDSANLLPHLILIGSWAEYLYETAGVIADFVSTTKTFDVDFLIKNIRRPSEPVNLMTLFEAEDYLVDISRMTGIMVFRKRDFEIEFLARQIGRPEKVICAPSYGLKVEALGHMNVIYQNTLSVNYLGMNVIVPHPYAFVFHKMIIHDKRGRKKEKDALAIKNIIFHMEDSKKFMDSGRAMYKMLHRKEQRAVMQFINEYELDLDLNANR